MVDRWGGPHYFVNVYVFGDTTEAGMLCPTRRLADSVARPSAAPRIGIWRVYLKPGYSNR